MKKPIGGQIITVKANTELITSANLGLTKEVEHLRVDAFYIKNEDTKDIFVKINNSEQMILKAGEMFNFKNLTKVGSCIVVTGNSIIRWGGLVG